MERLLGRQPPRRPPTRCSARCSAPWIEFWAEADRELDRLLRQRIDGFYRRMAVDLGTAALVWLISLGLILVVARQITGPIRELSRVAQRIRLWQGL